MSSRISTLGKKAPAFIACLSLWDELVGPLFSRPNHQEDLLGEGIQVGLI